MDNTSILAQFENILKQCILNYFNGVLSNDKITLLNGKKYIDNLDFTVLNNRDAIQGYILRGILNDIVDITCIINNNGNETIYGKSLNNLLVEFYARDISQKYQFNISINHELDDTNGFISLLCNVFKDNFNKYIFNFKVDKLLTVNGLESIKEYLDKEVLANNINNENVVQNEQVNNNVENSFNENLYTSNDGKIEFYNLDGINYFKYVDFNNNENVVKINENSKVHDYFVDRISDVSSTNDLKAGILYLELLDVIKTENQSLDTSNELNNEEINNLDYTTVLDPEQIQKINSGLSLNDAENEQNVRKLTPKEYEELCIKYSSGEELTPEQLNLLKTNSPELLNDIDNITPSTMGNHSGKISKKLIFIFAGVGLIIIGLVLFLILK